MLNTRTFGRRLDGSVIVDTSRLISNLLHHVSEKTVKVSIIVIITGLLNRYNQSLDVSDKSVTIMAIKVSKSIDVD